MGLEPYGEGMESGYNKPTTPPASVSEIVSKFAKVCKVRSIGVFPSENVNQNHQQNLYLGSGHGTSSFGEETSSSDATEEADFEGEKVQVAAHDVGIDFGGDSELLELFDTVKALCLAYVQLQEAHIPYDPDKIRAADGLVTSHLEALCKIKRGYKEKRLNDMCMNAISVCFALPEIQVKEAILQKLKSQLKVKDNLIVKLRQEFQDLELKKEKLAEEELRVRGRASVQVLNIPSLEETMRVVAKGIHDFAKPLISLMKVSGWDLHRAANVIQDSVVYTKTSDKKYAFEAYIARRMFHGFSVTDQSYDVLRLMKFDDPIDALSHDSQSSFAKYCLTKYLMIVHPEMEEAFFGHRDHWTFVTNGMHPNTPFYRAFVKMAKWMWILQDIAFSIKPKADMFKVTCGTEFSDVYMESVEELKEERRYKVEFMVLPGFMIGEKIIKSRVYLSEMKS